MEMYFCSLAKDQRNDFFARVMKAFFLFCSWIFRGIVYTRWFFYRKGWLPSYPLSRPVISVGNLTWGGVGKTPLVACIAAYFQAQGRKPAVLSRGYMSSGQGEDKLNDEALLLRHILPGVGIWAGHDRVRNAKKALEQNPPDVFILDDGFQYLRLKRDLNILAIDVTNPFGNGELIPRGILREPLKAISRADIVVLTKIGLARTDGAELREKIREYKPHIPIFSAAHQPIQLFDMSARSLLPLAFLKGKEVNLLCSIADPASFERMLECLGASVRKKFVYRDHFRYRREDVKAIIEGCRESGCECIITTQKDEVKLNPFLSIFPSHLQCLVLQIKMDIIEGQDDFFYRLSRLLSD